MGLLSKQNTSPTPLHQGQVGSDWSSDTDQNWYNWLLLLLKGGLISENVGELLLLQENAKKLS